MNLSDLQLAWRNLWRNRRRTYLSISGIAFAAGILVLMLSFQLSQYQMMLRAAVSSGTGYVQALAADYQDEPRLWLVLPNPDEIETVMKRQNRILAVAPQSEGFALLAGDEHSQGAMVIGVEPEAIRTVSTAADKVREGAFLEDGDFDQAVLGTLLARNLGVGIGDLVTVLGSARDGSVAAGQVAVKGVFESGQPEVDRATAYVPLDYFDEAFRMEGAVHRVVAKADGLWGLGGVAAEISREIHDAGDSRHPPVALTWNELLPGLLDGIKLDFSMAVVMYAVLVLVVAFSILNTFIMAVFERTREFGVMMAIGTTPWRLVRVVMLESGLLAFGGMLAGIFLGSLVTAWLASVGIDFGEETGQYMAQYGLPSRLYPELNVVTALVGPVIVFIVTLVAAFIPALRVRRMRPVEAIHAP